MDGKDLIVLILLGVVAIQITGIYDFGQITGKEVTPTGEDISKTCTLNGNVVTINGRDKFNHGNALGDTNSYKIANGEESSTKTLADAGSFTGSAGDTIKVWFQLRTAVDGNYYSAYKSEQLKCEPTTEITGDVVPRGNLTYVMFSQDSGNSLTHDGKNNETVGTGESMSLTLANVYMEAETGKPYGGKICMDYEKNNWSAADFQFTYAGKLLSGGAAVPSQHTSASVTKSTICYEAPAIEGPSPVAIAFSAKALSTANPGTNGRVQTNNDFINFTYYDYENFEGDTGIIGLYTEDPDAFTDIGDGNNEKFGILVY